MSEKDGTDDTNDTNDTDGENGTENRDDAAEDASTEDSEESMEKGGLASVLRDLVETVAETDLNVESETAVGRGRTDIGRASIGHDVSIGVGTVDDAIADAGGAAPASDAPEHPTSVEYDEGREALVAVDVPEIDPEDLSAGVSSRNGDLLVGDGDRIVERVPLQPEGLSLAAASYRNGVLEVHLTPEESGGTADE